MNNLIELAKKKIMAITKDSFFWRIQLFNVEYFLKYYAKFKLLIIACSISLSVLRIMINITEDDKTALFVINKVVSLLILIRLFYMTIDMLKVFYGLSNGEMKKEAITKFLKNFLLYKMLVDTKYLKVDYFETVHKESIISESMLLYSAYFLVIYLFMRLYTKQFWKRSVVEKIQLRPINQQEFKEFPFRLTETYLNERLKYSGTIKDFVTPLAIRTEYSRLSYRPFMIDKDQKKHLMERPVEKKNSVLLNLNYSLVAPKWVPIREVITTKIGKLSNAEPLNHVVMTETLGSISKTN